MKDLIDSLRLHIFERLSSPLFGAFCVAWLAWNHDYIFIMFSDLPINDRLDLAKNLIFPDWKAVALRGAAYPFVSAVTFILLYPFPARWLFGYWHRRQTKLKTLRDEIEGATLLTVEESRKVRSAMLAAQVEFEHQIEAQQAEIHRLKALKHDLTDQKPPPNAVTNPKPKQPNEAEIRRSEELFEHMTKVIEAVVAARERIRFHDLHEKLKVSPVRLRHYVDECEKAQLVTTSLVQATENDPYIILTPKGRKFAVEVNVT